MGVHGAYLQLCVVLRDLDLGPVLHRLVLIHELLLDQVGVLPKAAGRRKHDSRTPV